MCVDRKLFEFSDKVEPVVPSTCEIVAGSQNDCRLRDRRRYDSRFTYGEVRLSILQTARPRLQRHVVILPISGIQATTAKSRRSATAPPKQPTSSPFLQSSCRIQTLRRRPLCRP